VLATRRVVNGGLCASLVDHWTSSSMRVNLLRLRRQQMSSFVPSHPSGTPVRPPPALSTRLPTHCVCSTHNPWWWTPSSPGQRPTATPSFRPCVLLPLHATTQHNAAAAVRLSDSPCFCAPLPCSLCALVRDNRPRGVPAVEWRDSLNRSPPPPPPLADQPQQ
jgi:hypothetical protein